MFNSDFKASGDTHKTTAKNSEYGITRGKVYTLQYNENCHSLHSILDMAKRVFGVTCRYAGIEAFVYMCGYAV